MKNKIAILISGRGSNMANLIKTLPQFEYHVISDSFEAPGLKVAEELDVAATVIRNPYALLRHLKELQPDLICLAGYMKILGREFIETFPGKILNVHPSLLPSFPGLNAQQQALDYGVKVTGATVHFVTCGVDEGPIIRQAHVWVNQNDTVEELSARILEKEHRIYTSAVSCFMDDIISMPLEGRVVRWKNRNENSTTS